MGHIPKAHDAGSHDQPMTPAAQPSAEPIARVAGVYAGRTTVEPLNRAMVLPVGMALWSQPSAEPGGVADLRDAKWLDPECADRGACQSLRFKSAEPSELVRAARDAAETLDGAVRGYRSHDPAEVRDALRRALDATAPPATVKEVLTVPDAVTATGEARVVDDLVTLVMRMARDLKHHGHHLMADKAMDYLKRRGLQSSPLRDAATGEAPEKTGGTK